MSIGQHKDVQRRLAYNALYNLKDKISEISFQVGVVKNCTYQRERLIGLHFVVSAFVCLSMILITE